MGQEEQPKRRPRNPRQQGREAERRVAELLREKRITQNPGEGVRRVHNPSIQRRR